MIHSFRLRSTIVFFLFVTLYAIVGINLYVIQIKHHDFYKKLTVQLLKKHFPQAIERLEHNKDKHFMFIKRRLSPEEIEIIKAEKNPDIFLLSEPGRYYPLPSASPIIGLTDIDNKGLLGIELLYNHTLAGKPTTCYLEKDARSGYYYF